MTSNDITPSKLSFNGHVIRDRNEMLSLTDMWKAAGEPENKRPANWARKEGAEFIAFMADAENMPVGHIISAGRGRTGATFAHWQIGLAYAKYLSPEFHMWCNTVVRERMEGTRQSVSLPPDVLEEIRRTDGIARQLSHKFCVLEATVQALMSAVSTIAAVVSPANPGIYVQGKTSGEIWADAGLPANIKNGPKWLGNRLSEMGCQIDGNRRARIGLRGARMFDPDRAAACLKNGLLHKARVYASERMGQGKLRLVLSSREGV